MIKTLPFLNTDQSSAVHLKHAGLTRQKLVKVRRQLQHFKVGETLIHSGNLSTLFPFWCYCARRTCVPGSDVWLFAHKKPNISPLTTRRLQTCFVSIAFPPSPQLKWMMVSQACYPSPDGRRYSRALPPYIAFPERRFQLPSHDTRVITMADSQGDDSTPPRKRIAVAVRILPHDCRKLLRTSL